MAYVHDRERGQGLSEYALILALVGIAAIIAMTLFGEQLRTFYGCAVYSLEGLGGSTSISSFELIDPVTDEIIGGVSCGGTISLSDYPGTSTYALKANVSGDIDQIIFTLDGPTTHTQTENDAPYSLFGNTGDDHYGGPLAVGNYTLTAAITTNGGDTRTIEYIFEVTN